MVRLGNELGTALARVDAGLREATAGRDAIKRLLDAAEPDVLALSEIWELDLGPSPAKDAKDGRDLDGRDLDGRDAKPKPQTPPKTGDRYYQYAIETDELRMNPVESLRDDPTLQNVYLVAGACGGTVPVIHPDSGPLLLWVSLGSGFIVYEIFMTPYRLCFNHPADGFSQILEMGIINLFFIIDICLNFFVAHTEPNGELVKNHCKIIKHYTTTWFPIDLVASIPWDWISYLMEGGVTKGSQSARMLRMLRMFRFLRLVRLLRVAKLRKVLDRFEESIEGSPWQVLLLAIMKILLILFALAHVASCFWYLTGITYEADYGISWLTDNIPDYVQRKEIFYFWAFHFSMATMTTVGYGDITPTNTAEIVFTVVLLWVALIVFSACMGVLMNLINSMYEESQRRRGNFVELSKYMRWRVLPHPLRSRLRRYLNFVWDKNQQIGDYEMTVMDKLSPTLRGDLALHIFGKILRHSPFLSWMKGDKTALRKLASRAVTQFAEIGDLLFSYGELNSTVFFLVHGWATMSMGGAFEPDKREIRDELELAFAPDTPRPTMFTSPKKTRISAVTDVGKDKRRLGVARRAYTRTFDESVDLIQSVHDLDVFSFAEQESEDAQRTLKEKSIKFGDVAYVKSPAFFGESCLWHDEPVASEYGCKTLTRAEFTTISRPDVDYVIAELPYLLPRFLAFRDYVVKQTKIAAKSVFSPDGSRPAGATEDGVDRERPAAASFSPERLSTRDDSTARPPNQHPSFVPDSPTKGEKMEGRNVGWVG
jgi:hypothetical protein